MSSTLPLKHSDRVDTQPCRVPGCPHTTEVTKGRYAGLCAPHRAELAARIRQAQSNGGDPQEAARDVTHASLEELAKKIQPVARQLDRALALRRAAEHDVTAAAGELAALLRSLHVAANAAIKNHAD